MKERVDKLDKQVVQRTTAQIAGLEEKLVKRLKTLEAKMIADAQHKLDERIDDESKRQQLKESKMNDGLDFIKYLLNKQERRVNDLDRLIKGKNLPEYHHIDQVAVPQRVDSLNSLQTLNLNQL